jgi:hypothetical protein
MGLVFDPWSGRNRVLHALVVTLVMSRHLYVYLTHRQDFEALITGIEEAWGFSTALPGVLLNKTNHRIPFIST